MKNSAMAFKDIPGDYQSLVLMFMPKAIHDQIDYENTVEVIDAMAGHQLGDDQELFLDTLSTLVEAYKASITPSRPAACLQSRRSSSSCKIMG